MTLRARPVARRRGRAGWDSGDRRNNLINLGFVLAIVVSIVILVGYAAWSWYDDHFGSAATVNGVVITKDQLRNRVAIEGFRLDYVDRRIQTLLANRRITQADADSQREFIAQRRNQVASLALERLVDIQLMGKLAADRGITVTEAEIDEQLLKESTSSEQRHVWMIEIEPEPDPETDEITDEAKRAALIKAQQALGRLARGESWEDVARTVSTSGLAPQAGDLGWLAEESGYDEAFMAAVFAAELHTPTEIVEGDDEVYRIGRATELAPEEVDPAFNQSIEQADILPADYRAAAQSDVLRQKLSDSVVAELKQPGLQRHVLEIYIPEPNASQIGNEAGVKVRHILFSPNDDPAKAEDLPDEDPAWDEAEAEARAAFEDLEDDPDEFDETARAESDEASAKDTGGKQPWYYPSSTIDQAFKNAIFADDLEPGQVLEPVKSAFGWHVIQFLRNSDDTDEVWLEGVLENVENEADFRQAVRDNSEGEEAGEEGDVGWIAMGQLTDDLDTEIFETAIGQQTDVKFISGDGTYAYRILAEETREPTEEQIEIFEDSGFQYWYTAQKEDADIDYSLGSSSITG